MTQKELKSGESFFFNNELWCQENEITDSGDDFRQANIYFKDHGPLWARGFYLWFNGTLLHTSKTFKSLESRLDKLTLKWNLEESEEL